ncbi:MAG: hypothetical protein ACE5GV_13725 [Candidatus Scalindua sp.]
MIKSETEDYRDNLSTVRYVYRNKTRCRFNISGLQNSNTFAEYLRDKFRNREGIRKARPNTITGNILIEFNPESINHKEIFSGLKGAANDFFETEIYSNSRKVIPLYPQKKRSPVSSYPSGRKSIYPVRRNCKLCTKTGTVGKTATSHLNTVILHIAVDAVGTLILGGIARRYMGKYLSRLVF